MKVRSLGSYSTLGDTKQLESEQAIFLVNTDLEVDITPSETAEAEAERAVEAAKAAEAEQERQVQRALDRIKRAEALHNALPPEPHDERAAAQAEGGAGGAGASVERCVKVLVRLPSGGQLVRRFRLSDPLSHVFDYVESDVETVSNLRCVRGRHNTITP